MPELLSVHGRCPRCGQVLTLLAGQLQRLFRCGRCQYRVPGAALIEEARSSPPRLPPVTSPVLRPFEEDPDDQQTRVHLADEQSEVPIPAVPMDAPGPSRVPSNTPALQRFGSEGDDPEDQQTRLHVAGAFDAPMPRNPLPPISAAPPIPPPPAALPSRSPLPPARRAVPRDATLLGMPAAPLARYERATDDADDQATRMHLPDEPRASSMPSAPVHDHTLIGVAPARGASAGNAPLVRFDRVEDDPEDQNTRLLVPISYEEGQTAAELRPLVAARPSQIEWDSEDEALTGSGGRRFGRASLEFSRWIEDWVRDRHAALLITLALLCAVVAPLLDALTGGVRRGATVIAANLVLFFLWTLAFAWFGKLRNDAGVWDPYVGWTRLSTGLRLVLEDLGRFGSLPWPLKWRVLAEVSGALGLAGLSISSVLTLSQLVWGYPAESAPLLIVRAASGMLVLLSVVAARQTANVPIGFAAAPEVAAPAVALLPAVVDLSLPLSLGANRADSPVHQMLELLSHWQPREWPNQDSYIAVLERHLLRHMGWARVERKRWLGVQRSEGVAHLVVNDSLLLEVVRGFDAEAAAYTTSRMRMLAKAWRGKPAMIVIFDVSRSALLASDSSGPLETLHQSYPMLAVRMPSARISLA